MRPSPLDLQVTVHKALGHPVRARALALLRHGELCVCQIKAVLGVGSSTLSAHLAELKDAGLVAERKSGRWVHYRLADDQASAPLLAAVWSAVAGDPRLDEDLRLLERVTALPVAEICRPDFDLAVLRADCCAPMRAQVKGTS
jgi:DNA-binding transcriptional ArsR family regulator